MKKLFLFSLILVSLVLGLGACGGSNEVGSPAAPTIARVRLWITLSGNSDDPPVTTLTPEQTMQANIWARGTTEEKTTFKVNLAHGEEFATLVTNVHTEGTGKAVGVGGLVNSLEPGNYTFQAISGAFGEIIGSLDITVASAAPPAQPNTTPELSPLPSPLPAAATPTLSEQPDTATFQKYFSEMGLGKMQADAKSPQDIQRNVAAFTAGDIFTLYGTVIQEVQISAKYYDAATKQSADAPAPPTPLGVGGFASSSNFIPPVGKYEFKVYVGDILVAVFPFEVR